MAGISDHQKPNTCFRTLQIAFMLGLPFVMFYWMVPFLSKHSLGNDYVHFPIENQMCLLFSLKAGTFPLFIPGFFIGHSFAALTLGQMFHPLPHMASFLPGYWGGQALEWNTFLRLLSLGIAQAMLFIFLIRLKLRPAMSFLITFITVYNLRMLDVFRYGASLEAYTAHLMLIATIGSWYLQPRQKLKPLLMVVFTYMLIVSGHPQMMYYGMLGTGLFVMILPFYIAVMIPDYRVNIKCAALFWLKSGFLVSLGVLSASAYTVPFYFDFISKNSARVGRDFSWANSYLDTWIGSWSNFFNPFLSGVGSFGSSSLIILVLVLPVLRLYKTRIPKTIWTMWGMLIIIFLCMQGEKTFLYRLFWEYFPLANSFRGPGRMSFILPMLIMLLLSWITRFQPVSKKGIPIPHIKILAFSALILTLSFNSLIYILSNANPGITRNILSPLSLFFFNLQDPFLSQGDAILTLLITTWAGIFLLFIIAISGMTSKASHKVIFVICLLTVIQVVFLLRHGTYYRKKKGTRTFEQITKQNRVNLSYPFYPGGGMLSSDVEVHLEKSFGEPCLAKIYKHIIPVHRRDDAYARMLNHFTPQTAYIEDFDAVNQSLPSETSSRQDGGEIKLKYSSYNRLSFKTDAPSPAIFGLAYPHSAQWKAWINGQETKIYRINGLYIGVEIPGGHSQVEFRYFSSAAYWGMMISCAALFLILSFYICSLKTPYRIIGVLGLLVITVSAFKSWESSLYSGKNLGRDYEWSYKPESERQNQAYGKTISANTNFPEFHSSSMVDGDILPNSGFISKFHKKPTVILDLRKIIPVNEVVLFETGDNLSFAPPGSSLFGLVIQQLSEHINLRPMVIDVSTDGEQWYNMGLITSPKENRQIRSTEECLDKEPLVLKSKDTRNVQYIRIQVEKGIIGFDEIEVY
ncbi:MAG: YfhO family protein [Candidatus Omnitrophica bacterium]|nr:YfhO family protein [Candidatus Omnitrophota bacterium]